MDTPSVVRAAAILAVLGASVLLSACGAEQSAHTLELVTLPQDVNSLLVALRSTNTRDAALAKLSNTVTEDDLPLLHDALLRNSRESVRWRAARLLGIVLHPSSVKPLHDSLSNDGSRLVRLHTAWALGRVQSITSEPILTRAAVNDPDWTVRLNAAASLKQLLGSAADRTIRGLQEREEDSGVRYQLSLLLNEWKAGTFTPRVTPGKPAYGAYQNTQYLVYVPTTYNPSKKSRLLVSVHGTNGDPAPYADMCREDAERYGFIVIAPNFNYFDFPNYDHLEFMIGSDVRSDTRLFEIIDQAASVVNLDTNKFWLYGHSKGGQFVTRFVLAHPDRILRAAAAGSGNYIMPNPNASFPDGTRPNALFPDSARFDFRNLVETPMAVVLGTAELERRVTAANRFMDAVNAHAREHRLTNRVQLYWVSGGGHSGRNNFPTAAKFLFDGYAPH